MNSVREMRVDEIGLVVDYFRNSDARLLTGMGVQPDKLPSRKAWVDALTEISFGTDRETQRFYLAWLFDGKPIGHSNLSDIEFGSTARIHLHLWDNCRRQSGLGFEFLNLSIPVYFQRFELQTLVCEPYALNPSPNRILKKFGFRLVKQYETIPGPICFSQTVNRYELSRASIEVPERH